MEKYNRWTVLEEAGRDKDGCRLVKVVCDCGTEKIIKLTAIKNNRSKSCGCLAREINGDRMRKDNPRHKQKLYGVWKGMKRRCYNPSDHAYKNYGGKGVRMCDQWFQDYDIFKEWAMTHGYAEGLTIDRINSNGNYEPSNCQWITKGENSARRNKENGHLVRSIFSQEDIDLAKQMREQGYVYREIGEVLNCGISQASRMANGEIKNPRLS